MYDLRQHQKSVHENIKLFCELCAEAFNNRSNLSRHKIMKHSNKPKYKCTICDREFFELNSFQGHMNMHNNARPYVCDACGKDFVYKYSLVRHQLSCSNKDTVKFVCKVCGKGLKTAECLRAHTEGVHGPKKYHCICEKAFSWRGALLRHKKKCMMTLTLLDEENSGPGSD